MHDKNHRSNDPNQRRQRLLDEVKHPHPWRRIAVAVLVGGALLLAALLVSCQP